MFLANRQSDYRLALDPRDADTLSVKAAEEVERFLRHRENHAVTPLRALPALARELGVGAIHVKDEGARLGLGSFKALGGSYAVISLALEAAAHRLGRAFDVAAWRAPALAPSPREMTFACATDGNHGRSVAQGAQLAGRTSVVFVHAGVSQERGAGDRRLRRPDRAGGRRLRRFRPAKRRGRPDRTAGPSSPTPSWPGYEPSRAGDAGLHGDAGEASAPCRGRRRMSSCRPGSAASRPPSPAIFAAALADRRPTVRAWSSRRRAACVLASARVGRPVKIDQASPR